MNPICWSSISCGVADALRCGSSIVAVESVAGDVLLGKQTVDASLVARCGPVEGEIEIAEQKNSGPFVHYTKCGLVSTAVCGVRAAALCGVLVMGDVASVHRTEVGVVAGALLGVRSR